MYMQLAFHYGIYDIVYITSILRYNILYISLVIHFEQIFIVCVVIVKSRLTTYGMFSFSYVGKVSRAGKLLFFRTLNPCNNTGVHNSLLKHHNIKVG